MQDGYYIAKSRRNTICHCKGELLVVQVQVGIFQGKSFAVVTGEAGCYKIKEFDFIKKIEITETDVEGVMDV